MVMVACLLLLFLLTLNQAFAQPGFLSIQSCTSSEPTDPLTKIKYTSDDYLLEGVGICKNVSGSFVNNFFSQTARIFGNDDHDQWCYNLPVVEGQGYLLRATFEYGPLLRSITGTTFTLSIGTTSISQINSSVDFMMVEGVFAATKNHTSMCLRKGIGNAYISKIEMRPLDNPNYVQENSSIVLKLMHRVDLGNNVSVYRYPEDSADRIWNVDVNSRETDTLSSSTISLRGANSSIPIEVLETAAQNAEHLQFLHTDLDTSCDDYLINLYFLELDVIVKTGLRVFDVYVNGGKMYEKFDILQNGSSTNYREVSMRVKSNGYLNISLVQSSNGEKYGPICNAYEIFQVHQKSVETVQRDWNAMLKLKEELLAEDPTNEMMKTWYGDPCMPSPWEGLACEKRDSTLVITKLDLSAMKLEGPLPTFITNLAELRELNIPNDGFAGSIPESLTSHKRVLLSKLPIICKNISSKLPSRLSDRENLTVNCIVPSPSQTQKPQLNCSGACVDGGASEAQSPSRNIYVIGTVAGGSVAVSVAVGIFFTCFYRCGRPKKKEYPIMKNVVFSDSSIREPSMAPTVQSFSLQYIQKATSNYSTLIGEGGFGAVYRGTLPHGEEVAVKVWSATSTQGTREFDNEVSLLSTIRHENLVPLLGYCCENDQQILVYPFMSNGSLQDRLYGEASKRKVLDWPTRLSIALGAARGLLYLHSFGRCIIHRDVKSSNILLDHTMCGKVADFGFSKYAPQEGDSAASLEVRGTAGYLDPEYYSTQQLSTKSDVFSFGVVLLEVVTGREPLNVQRPRNEWSLVEWAKPFIRESRIDEIVDPNIKTGYHAEAMWRVVEAALACIEPFSTYRPSMVDIVRELEDALIIENNASEYMRSIESFGGSNRFGSNRFGSNRFISLERKVLSSTSSPPQPTPPNYSQVPAPLPR